MQPLKQNNRWKRDDETPQRRPQQNMPRAPFRGGRAPFRGGRAPFRGGRAPFRGGRAPFRGRSDRYGGRRQRSFQSRNVKNSVRRNILPKFNDEKEFPSLNPTIPKKASEVPNFMKAIEKSIHKPSPKHIRRPVRTPPKKKEVQEEIDYDDPNYTEYMDRVYLSDEEDPPTPSITPKKHVPTQVKIGGFNPPNPPPVLR